MLPHISKLKNLLAVWMTPDGTLSRVSSVSLQKFHLDRTCNKTNQQMLASQQKAIKFFPLAISLLQVKSLINLSYQFMITKYYVYDHTKSITV